MKHIKQLEADIYCFMQRCLQDSLPLYDDECLLWSHHRLSQDQDEWLLHVSLHALPGLGCWCQSEETKHNNTCISIKLG